MASGKKTYKPQYLSGGSNQNIHQVKSQNYSHVHDSLENGEIDQVYDHIGDEILIKDNVQVPDPFDLGPDKRFEFTQQPRNPRGSSSVYDYGGRGRLHQGGGLIPQYYNQQARSGGHSRTRRRTPRTMDISDKESQDYLDEARMGYNQTGPSRTFVANSDWKQVELQRPYELSPGPGNFAQGSYRVPTELATGIGTEYNGSSKFSAPVGSSIHNIKGDERKKRGKSKGKKNKHKNKRSKRSRSSDSSSSSSSQKSSSSSSSSGSSSSRTLEREKINYDSDSSQEKGSDSSKLSENQHKKGKASKKDKKKKKGDKKKKKDKKKSKKEKSRTPTKVKKDKKKDKKKKNGSKHSHEEELSYKEAWKLAQEAGIESVLQVDTLALLKDSFQQDFTEGLQRMFKVYRAEEDDTVLISNLIGESENLLHNLYEQNFSNSEMGILMKLRRSRNAQYQDAFHKFRSSRNKDQLIANLKVIVEENLQLSGKKLNSPYLKPGMIKNQQEDIQLIKHVSKREKLEEIFEMAYQTDFINLRSGAILAQAFGTGQSQELTRVLEDYMTHNDYLRLKNELTKIADQIQQALGEEDFQSEYSNQQDFNSLLYAIAWFTSNNHLNKQDERKLKELNEQKHRQLQSIWDAYKVIKDTDDLLDSLQVFLRVRRQNEEVEKAEQAKIAMSNAQYDDNSSLSKESDPLHTQAQNNIHQQMQQHAQMERNQRPQPLSTGAGGGFGLRLTATQHGNTPEQIPQNYEKEMRQEEEDQQLDDGELDQSYEEDLVEEENEEEANRAELRLAQICRYSHKILRKYIVNGMISFADGPQLHNLVEAKDYRIICILEVYSQNKNEDDFLENLGLLSQVIREQEENAGLDMEASVGNEREASTGDDGPVESQEPDEQPQEDSIIIEISKAQSMGKISSEVATFAIDAWKAQETASRKVKTSYKVYKQSNDIEDFNDSLTKLMQKFKK